MKGECIDHPGPYNNSGYGNYNKDGINGAHQKAWVDKYGAIPEGLCVLHECDNRKCINTDHMFLGTKSDNSQDSWDKGRNYYQMHPEARPKAENHKNAKLTNEQVKTIRKEYEQLNTKQTILAERYGVSQRVISLVVRGQGYGSVE